MTGARASVASLVVALLTLGPALANAQETLVLPVARSNHEAERVRRVADLVAEQLRARGATVIAAEEAERRFEAQESAEPASPAMQQAVALAECADAVVTHVALGRYEAALQTLQHCQQTGSQALESVNREGQSARRLFDLCLYGVRALLRMDEERRAFAEVMRCRRVAPDLAPDPQEHPADVVALLERAQRELAESQAAVLAIDSQPAGCPLYLNGRRLGTTPQRFTHLAPGLYRVQADCGGSPGRVHHVELGEREPQNVVIDGAFESAVATRSGVALVYDDRAAAEPNRFAHAVRIADAVGSSEVWTVTPLEGELMQVDRISLPMRRVLATARIASSLDGTLVQHDAAGAAVAALQEGRSVDLSQEMARDIDPWRPPSAAAAEDAPLAAAVDEPHFANWLIGGGLMLGGVVALISPIHTLARLGECAEPVPFPDGSIGCRREFVFGPQSATLTALGVAAIVGGVVFGLVSPIRVSVGATPSSASLSLTGEF